MSTTRCEHGEVTSDTVGEYRCFVCKPVTDSEVSELASAKLIAALSAVIEDHPAVDAAGRRISWDALVLFEALKTELEK